MHLALWDGDTLLTLRTLRFIGSLISGGGDGNIHVYDLDDSEREERRIIKSMVTTQG